ncbi:MAG: hypothetical protein WCL53_09500 [Chloroflexota bacterium]
MSQFVNPDEIAFEGVDAMSLRLARQMGYRGRTEVTSQDFVRLPEFGPRKIGAAPDLDTGAMQHDDPADGDWFLFAGEPFNRRHIFGDRTPR